MRAQDGVRLNYLDWGGRGPVVVMIHGLGDDPHVFDDLASRVRGRFRVVAYARRGHGASDAPPGPYDPAMLVDDLRQVMDQLRIRRASLVGWSMGGNEITSFAGRHPERVDRLVYFDSGYDWSTPAFFDRFTELFGETAPSASDTASLDSLRAWFRRNWLGDVPWSDGLEAYLRDLARPDAAGKLHPVPSDATVEACLAAVRAWPRDYTKVRAPALALYAPVFFPNHAGDSALARKLREFETNIAAPFRRDSIARMRLELRDVRIVELAGRTHMSIGVEKPDELAALVVDFLAGGAGEVKR